MISGKKLNKFSCSENYHRRNSSMSNNIGDNLNQQNLLKYAAASIAN